MIETKKPEKLEIGSIKLTKLGKLTITFTKDIVPPNIIQNN